MRREIVLPAVILALLLVSLLTACASPTLLPPTDAPEASATPSRSLAAFTENGVAVEIVAQLEPSGRGWLSGTFTPMDAGFHLYSHDLPRNGLYGQGRPTLLEIISAGRIKLTGALVANQQTVLLDQGLLVYPEGPVTLSWPIAWSGSSAAAPTELSITYMACSASICLKPVIDKRVSVVIPDLPIQKA